MPSEIFYVILAVVGGLVAKIVFDWIKKPNGPNQSMVECKTLLYELKTGMTWLRDVHDEKLNRILEELRRK